MADPYAWMDKLGAAPAAPPSDDASVPGLRDRFSPQRAPKGFEQAAAADGAQYGVPVAPTPEPSTTGGEAFARGAGQGASLGFGDEIAAGVDTAASHIPGLRWLDEHTGGHGAAALDLDPAKTYAERRDAYRSRNKLAEKEHGGAYLAGEIGGGLVAPIPGGSAVGEARGLVQGIKAAASTGAKVGALSGLGNSEDDSLKGALYDTAKGGLVGATAGAGTSLVGELGSKVVKGAAQRVLDRSAVDVTTGEQNAGKRISAKFTDRVGEDNENLNALYERHPEIKKALALDAKANPGKAADAVGAKVSEVGDKLDAIEKVMDTHGVQVDPMAIVADFDKMIAKAEKGGDEVAIGAMERARDAFANRYGDKGTVTAEQLRGLKRTAGHVAFAGDPTAPASAKAQVNGDVWRLFSGVQEQAAKATPGVDAAELRALNQDMATLKSMQQPLDERAASAKANRKSIGEHIMTGAHSVGGLVAGAVVGHPVAGAIAGLVAPAARRAGAAVVRRADYAMSENPYLANVLEGLNRGLALPAAVEAAQGASREATDR